MNLIRACKAFIQALKKQQKTDRVLEKPDRAHLRLLTLLQKEGRFIDFLQEDISSYSDAQVGAAVRNIHTKCRESLEEFVTLRPLFLEEEGARVTISQGYDVHQVKLVGKIQGNPPYQGILRHKGWKAHKESLPKQIDQTECSVISPAEVEVG